MKISFCYFAVLISLLGANTGFAQQKDRWKETAWEEIDQTVTPAEITQDSLTYKLFDDSAATAQHNSATYYYRACLKWAAMPKNHRAKLYSQQEPWFRGPLSDLPQVAVEQWLSKTEPALKELRKGLAGKCDWGIEDSQGLSIAEMTELDLSVELTVLREFADVLRLQARLHLARSEFQQAVSVLAATIKLSQDITRLPGFLPPYSAINIARNTLSTINEMASLPNSPNMFRALQTLPNPIVNFRPVIRKQYDSVQRSLQFLDDPESSNRSDDQWRAVFLDGLEQLDESSRSNYERTRPDSWNDIVASRERRLGLLLAKLFPSAKRELVNAGWDKEKLDAMHVGQVIAIQTRRLWDRHVQLLQGIDNLSAAEVRERSKQMESGDLLYGELLGAFPVQNVITTQENLLLSRWSNFEISMNVEKLRHHLAKTGSFPNAKQFQAMSPCPDPQTDQPFEYRLLENGDAQIQSSPIGEEDYVRTRYTIKKAQQ